MTPETLTATTAIGASAAAVFSVLADPTQHAAIDGTGRVRGAVDPGPITAAGQVFRMTMFHPGHPDGTYEIHNLVLAYEQGRTIGWRPGYVADPGSGELEFGGWTWCYDLTPLDVHTCRVVLTYDWSAVGPGPRQYLDFPPFAPDHLTASLAHLREIVLGRRLGPARTPLSRRARYAGPDA